MPIKIAFDISALETGHRVRGVGTYIYSLTKNIKMINDPDINFVTLDFLKQPGELAKYDLLHYPFFDLFFPTLLTNKVNKTIVTIHDVIPLIFPDHYPPGLIGKINFYRQKHNLRQVSAVVTDSTRSKEDINHFLEYPLSQISVIPLGAKDTQVSFSTDTSIQKKVQEKYQLSTEYVLYVGDVNYNKNLLSLVKACKKINICLVIVGKQAVQVDFDQKHVENEPLRELIDDYGQDPQIKRLGYVSDEDLNTLYSLASVYCQPSYYEGFGLPVLEAMAQGCPVVCSNLGSLPEVAGQAALFFDPYDIDQITQTLSRVISDQNLRSDLIIKGKQQAAKFTWLNAAQQTLHLYKHIKAI